MDSIGVVTPRNRILARIEPALWEALRGEAQYVHLPVGHVLAHPGDPFSTVYFPETGVISAIASMASGHSIEVGAFGREGFVGAAVVLAIEQAPYSFIVQSRSEGYQLPAESLRRAFREHESVRLVTLSHVGRMLQQFARSAVCNRFHSQRERLARWLLLAMHRSETTSLELTHDFIAQMIGGPRHAVTAALHELRDVGVVTYERGHIELVDEARLVSTACECYAQDRAMLC